MRKKLWTISAVMLFAVMTLSACTGTSSVRHHNTNTETSTAVNADKSTGVIRKIDKDTNNIVIYSVDDGTKTIYSYDEGTTAYTKSGKVMSFDKLSCGDIVDIECNNTNQKIKKISISSRNKVWENTKVTNFKVDESTMTMKIGQSLYSYSDSTFVFSDGEEIDISELNSEDRLIVRGYDTSVCSVVVDKGHGYVTLSGDQLFIGGYVDIGGRVVKVIEEGMLLIVQEGSYKVEVRNGKYIADKQITVTRDEKTVADFSDVAPIVTETGNVRINVNVSEAILTVDGAVMSANEVLTLAAGKHTIKVSADGYSDYSTQIEVDKGYKTIDVTLKAAADDETSKETKSETQTETETATTDSSGNVVSQKNKVTVSGPEGGYIYFDGKYMGTAPVTFALVTGEHVISVLYNKQINSYTVNLSEGGDDVKYDFTPK